MVKGGKLGKIKWMIKKWQNMSKVGRSNSNIDSKPEWERSCDYEERTVSDSGDKNGGGYQAVYVGKSRRRYLISSQLVNHPLVRVLVEKSGESDTMVVGCEVVLFEHLLWMLENADPQPDSLDELVDFYAC